MIESSIFAKKKKKETFMMTWSSFIHASLPAFTSRMTHLSVQGALHGFWVRPLPARPKGALQRSDYKWSCEGIWAVSQTQFVILSIPCLLCASFSPIYIVHSHAAASFHISYCCLYLMFQDKRMESTLISCNHLYDPLAVFHNYPSLLFSARMSSIIK